jgi:hypothetical protein
VSIELTDEGQTMARGKPARGFRITKRMIADNPNIAALKEKPTTGSRVHITNEKNLAIKTETDEEIGNRLKERFDILDQFATAAMNNQVRSLIVSGPAGLGKSWTVEQAIKRIGLPDEDHVIVKGYLKPTGLYKTLWQYRHSHNVLVFDDSDSIFSDEQSLNFLKTACDTTEIRELSYLSEYVIFDEKESTNIPSRFMFDSTVIFITNLDFDKLIDQNHKYTEHLKALISRSHYIDLTLKTRRDYIIRIKQVIREGLLKDEKPQHVKDVLAFIEKHQDQLRELSLRMAIKLAHVRKVYSASDWEKVARVTCCRNS